MKFILALFIRGHFQAANIAFKTLSTKPIQKYVGRFMDSQPLARNRNILIL